MLQVILLSILAPGGIYVWGEVTLDGTSHWSMGVVGAIAFNICRLLIGLPYPMMAILSSIIITVLELTAGLIVNKNHTIWDYRKFKYNFKGQICLRFYLLWLILMPPVIILVDSILPKFK